MHQSARRNTSSNQSCIKGTKLKIKKSYHFHFVLASLEDFEKIDFFRESYFDYIFHYKSPFPEYIEQGICDILPNKNGILFSQTVLQQLEPSQLLNDFQACFVFNLPTDICDPERSRYNRDFTFDFDMEGMKDEVPMEMILQYEESPWKPILEINPDFFYLKHDNQMLLGSKDYKQVENWISEIWIPNIT